MWKMSKVTVELPGGTCLTPALDTKNKTQPNKANNSVFSKSGVQKFLNEPKMSIMKEYGLC